MEFSQDENKKKSEPLAFAPAQGLAKPAGPTAARFAALMKTAAVFSPDPELEEEAEEKSEETISQEDAGEVQSDDEINQSSEAQAEETIQEESADEPAASEETTAETEPEIKPEPPKEKVYKHLTFRKPEENPGVRKIAEFIKGVDEKIKSVKHFKTGKLDDYGHIVGIHEFTPGRVPHIHQDHFYDELGRVIKFQKYEQEFSKPTTRVYFYDQDGDKLMEAVWVDRYGKIENIHRYSYDGETGLMKERAEYDREGRLFYSIRTAFDLTTDPPRQIEEAWFDPAGKPIKRLVYKYDESGEICTEERFDANNIFDGAFHFEYDERGILKQKSWQSKSGRVMSAFRYEVDADEKVTKTEMLDENMVVETIQTLTYDDIGNVKEEVWKDGEGKVIRQVKY
ncbi:MAG: hypothetical protein LWY06_02020 [Firmicutes bacterium]|nr:hypothetical protein [Bacillota bacterium]